MNNWPQKLSWGLLSFILPHIAQADSGKILAPEGSDKLPNVPYTKHDPNRPQPQKLSGQCLNTQAPIDAIVLFDGTNLDAFQTNRTSAKNSKITEDGTLILGPGGLTSQVDFGDCQVHLEWRIPKKNKIVGQQGSNSGILLMGLFEVQILESHSNLSYADGMAGAMYGERPPLKNASLAQGEWQSFDIFFKAPIYIDKKLAEPAKLTLLYNGILVHLDQPFEFISSYRKNKDYPAHTVSQGPIQIKWDGDPVEYRNIWARHLNHYDETPKVAESKTAAKINTEKAKEKTE